MYRNRIWDFPLFCSTNNKGHIANSRNIKVQKTYPLQACSKKRLKCLLFHVYTFRQKSMIDKFQHAHFLKVVNTQLYKRLCPSIDLLVHLSAWVRLDAHAHPSATIFVTRIACWSSFRSVAQYKKNPFQFSTFFSLHW